MLDTQVTELADRLIQAEFAERRRILEREISMLGSQFNARGTYHSSMHIDAVAEACKREISIRGRIVLQVYIRVLSQLCIPPYEGIAQDLKQKVEYFVPYHTDYSRHVDQLASSMRMMDRLPFTNLAEARDQAIKRIGAEIDLFALSQKKQTEERQSGTSTYNFYSTVGAFQTGAGSVANVIQSMSPDDREALSKALNLLRNELSTKDHLFNVNKQEILDLVDESQAEIRNPKPNGLKLSSLFSTIANAIQTVGTLNSAYQTLKAALLPLGIMLP